MFTTNFPIVTVVTTASHAGDTFLHILEGRVTDLDVQYFQYAENPSWWGSPDNVIVQEKHFIRFTQDKEE